MRLKRFHAFELLALNAYAQRLFMKIGIAARMRRLSEGKDKERLRKSLALWLAHKSPNRTLLRNFCIEWMLRSKVWYQQAFWRWKFQAFGNQLWFKRPKFLRNQYVHKMKSMFNRLKKFGEF
jgi:hypothetical protein